MEQKDKFALRWDNYEKTIVEVFQKIRGDHDFYDCTLVCNGIKINAHRVIISACSPVFRDMLRISSHPHPVLYLRGVRQEDLEWILDFMYNGEVLLEESELEVFLKIAEELQVQGLCQVGNPTSSSPTVNQDVHDILSDLEQPDQKRIKRDPELSKNEEKSKDRKAVLSTFGPGVSVSVKKEPNSHPRRESNSTVASLQETILHSPAGSTSSEQSQLLRSSPHIPLIDRVRTPPLRPPSTPVRPPSTPGGVKRSAPTDRTSPGIPPQSPVSTRPQTLFSGLPPGFLQIHNNAGLSKPLQFPQQPSVIPNSPSNSEIPDPRNIQLLRNVASPPVLHIPEALVEQASQPRSLPSSVQSSVQGAVLGSSHSNVRNYVQSSVSNIVLSGLLNSIPSNVQSIDLNNVQTSLQSGDYFNRTKNVQYSVQNSTSRSVHNSVQSSTPSSISHSSSIPSQIHGPHPAARPAEPYVTSNLLTQNLTSILAGHAAALQRQELQGSNPGRELSQSGNLHQSPGDHGFSGMNPQLGGVQGVHAQIRQPHGAQSVSGSSGQVDSQDKEYDAQIKEYIEREETPDGPILKCKACPKNVKLRNKQTLISHVESTHLLATISCSNCDQTFKARNYLKQHLKRGVCTQNIGNT